MGDKTAISWTDATWNPLRGCSKVSAGCKNCYAEKIAYRFGGPGRPFEGLVHRGHWTGEVRFIAGKLDQPLRWRKPRMIFVNSVSDLFHENVPFETIAAIFGVMAASPRHTFQVLTKRAGRMREWFEWVSRPGVDGLSAARYVWLGAYAEEAGVDSKRFWEATDGEWAWPLPNVWIGVSVEDQATADERIPLLLATPAALRFVSYEPALGPVTFRHLQPKDPPTEIDALAGTHGVLRPHGGKNAALDWLIVGGESGPGARPCDVAWIRSTVEQCREAGVKCFVKQLGARAVRDVYSEHLGQWEDEPRELHLPHPKGADPSEWPEDLRVQEMPEADRG